MNTNLLDQTLAMLSASTMPRRQVADGAGVDYEWLAKFAQRRIGDPGVRKVQRLHDFLAAQSAPTTPAEAA